MPQKLYVTETDSRSGKETRKELVVLRAWQDAGGGQLMLFSNGVYGHKDGSPVRDPKEFEIIGSSHHKNAALAWWKRSGKEIARVYYEAIDAEERRRAGDYNPVEGADTEKDAVLYYRQDAGSGEVQGPFSWMDLFPKRPDWWGQSRAVAFDDYEYVRLDEYEKSGAPLPSPSAGQPGAAPQPNGEGAPAPPAGAEDPAWDYYVFKDPETTYPSRVFKHADHGDGAQLEAAKWAAEKGYERIEARPGNEAAAAIAKQQGAADEGDTSPPAGAAADAKDLEI